MSNWTVGLYSNTGNTPTEDALKHVINHQFDWLINCQGTISQSLSGKMCSKNTKVWQSVVLF
jgi:hypothetical protein